MTREEAIEILNRDDDSMRKGYFCINDFKAIEVLKSEEPSEDDINRKATWIRWREEKEKNGYIESIPHCKCSKCGNEYDTHTSKFIKYCPNCGAKIIEREVEE